MRGAGRRPPRAAPVVESLRELRAQIRFEADVGVGRSRGIRPDEEQDREPDVPENEAEEAPHEGHREAPNTDPRQHKPVHRLEYPP